MARLKIHGRNRKYNVAVAASSSINKQLMPGRVGESSDRAMHDLRTYLSQRSEQFCLLDVLFNVVSDASELTGMTNLMSYYGLEHSYNKFGSKKVKEELSAFLPTLPGNIDMSGNQDNRSAVSSVRFNDINLTLTVRNIHVHVV